MSANFALTFWKAGFKLDFKAAGTLAANGQGWPEAAVLVYDRTDVV